MKQKIRRNRCKTLKEMERERKLLNEESSSEDELDDSDDDEEDEAEEVNGGADDGEAGESNYFKLLISIYIYFLPLQKIGSQFTHACKSFYTKNVENLPQIYKWNAINGELH